jgi:hypothetical protein
MADGLEEVGISQTQKRPRHAQAFDIIKSEIQAVLATDRRASDGVDIGAVDTEVLKLTRAHTAKFGNGLTVFAPVVERACYVHDNPLS